MRHDVRQRRLAKPRWAKEQYVIERFATFFSRTNKNFKLLADFDLPHVVVQ